MSRIPDYKEWRARLCAWVENEQMTLQGASIFLASGVQKQTGVSISPFTLRYHVEGRYDDVGLIAAGAVWAYLDWWETQR